MLTMVVNLSRKRYFHNLNIYIFLIFFKSSVESASMVDCPDLIKDYILKNKVKTVIKLPMERSCKFTEEKVPFENLVCRSKKRFLGLCGSIDNESSGKMKLQVKGR